MDEPSGTYVLDIVMSKSIQTYVKVYNAIMYVASGVISASEGSEI